MLEQPGDWRGASCAHLFLVSREHIPVPSIEFVSDINERHRLAQFAGRIDKHGLRTGE
ncbi:MAG: hypothetical protein ACRD3G_32050 [Vicinamibacterales bacterium]